MSGTASNTVRKIPVVKSIKVLQGALFSMQLTILNSDGSAFDLTNYSGRGEIRKSQKTGSTLLATFTVTIDAPATDGIITISLGATATTAITSNGFYDIEIENTGDAEEVRRLLQGEVQVDKNVTI